MLTQGEIDNVIKNENKELEKQYEEQHSDVTTNDRKTYYENQEIDFLNFISSNNGDSNAYTEMNSTCYYLNIMSSKFKMLLTVGIVLPL